MSKNVEHHRSVILIILFGLVLGLTSLVGLVWLDQWPKCFQTGRYCHIVVEQYMSVSINGVYKKYDHMHVAFPRFIPANHTTNHTHESYYESYP